MSSSKRSFVLTFILVFSLLFPLKAFDSPFSSSSESFQDFFLTSKLSPTTPQVMEVILTGYSSSFEETDDDPYITASGKRPYFGIVASNFLPLGTKIKIPEIFGEKIFVVEDRMNPRFKDRIDIWFPSSFEAKLFGIKKAKIYIL